MKLNPDAIARASSLRPWQVIGVWVVALIAAGALSSSLLASVLTTDFDFTDEPESKRALLLIEERRGATQVGELVVVTSDSNTVNDAAFIELVNDLKAAIVALGPDVVVPQSVVSFQEVPIFASADGTKAVVSLTLANPDLDEASDDAVLLADAVDAVGEPAGFETLIFGQGSINNDFVESADETLKKGESFGVVIALIVLVVVIGALVAATLPIILAIGAIALSFGVVVIVGQIFELSFFVTNMITMIGLAVGIDYALFIVARYREERVRGSDKLEAIGRAGATANRAVFFSGLTVVLALVGMLFVPKHDLPEPGHRCHRRGPARRGRLDDVASGSVGVARRPGQRRQGARPGETRQRRQGRRDVGQDHEGGDGSGGVLAHRRGFSDGHTLYRLLQYGNRLLRCE